MSIGEMKKNIPEIRKKFREMLTVAKKHEELYDSEEIRNWLLNRFDDCSGEFEEQTLIENLKEEFGLYLEELRSEGE